MKLQIFEDKGAMSSAAAAHAARALRKSIAERGRARIIAATGASQLDFLDALTKSAGIEWQLVEMFHLDEYIGLPATHPASFRKYLLDNFVTKAGITRHHFLDGDKDPKEVNERVGKELTAAPIDVAFVGIGENAHLAFNDPPADFKTERPYLVVDLDEACRRQQVGEGWFAEISEVPRQAISMSVRQILKSNEIIAIVPDARKAEAVQRSLEGEIKPETPASILRSHPATTLYLDKASAGLLNPQTILTYQTS
ncbi:MAG TPA: glucosamine-6-phosphate deaminase [Candidatus Binatia bacterium]|nr:glucosamine-6-phosphate deaminase [Candidatus Binatia bacterium]